MKTFTSVLTILGSALACWTLFTTLNTGHIDGATASAVATVAIAFAIIPYCFGCAVDGFLGSSSETELKKLNEQLATHTTAVGGTRE